LLELSLQHITLFHFGHELINIHFKRQFTVFLERIDKVLAKEPAIPRVYGCAFFLIYDAEVELIAISTFQEERASVRVVV
jgi:hypothetical protein